MAPLVLTLLITAEYSCCIQVIKSWMEGQIFLKGSRKLGNCGSYPTVSFDKPFDLKAHHFCINRNLPFWREFLTRMYHTKQTWVECLLSTFPDFCKITTTSSLLSAFCLFFVQLVAISSSSTHLSSFVSSLVTALEVSNAGRKMAIVQVGGCRWQPGCSHARLISPCQPSRTHTQSDVQCFIHFSNPLTAILSTLAW